MQSEKFNLANFLKKEEKNPPPHNTGNQKVMDLDDLFGNKKEVLIRQKGIEYPMKSPENLSPKEFLEFERQYKTYLKLGISNDDDVTEEKAEILENIVRGILSLVLSKPRLPIEDLTFVQCVRVMEFYLTEVNEDLTKKKKDLQPRK